MLIIETFARAQHIRGPPGSSTPTMIDIASINKTFTGGIFQNHAAANARGLVLQNVPLSARQSSLERTLPLRLRLATDTHRSRRRDDLRLTGFCRPFKSP